MRAYDIFFFCCFFFLFGILLSSFGLKEEILIFVLAGFFAFLVGAAFFKKRFYIILAFLCFAILPGALYYTNYQETHSRMVIPFDENIGWRGRVGSPPERGGRQTFTLKLLPPRKGNILIQTALYPEYRFGEIITFSGSIQKTKGDYGSYLEHTKDIRGISYFPNLEKREGATTWRGLLFGIKERFLLSFRNTLPYTEAAFLGGITVGEREEFSKEFKDAMSRSGTSHLVALSGYNIIIILNILGGCITGIMSRKKAFWVTLTIVLGFVLMTGAEASVVRAAIMGILVAVAPFLGRLYAPRNSIILTALCMALWNPEILRHDLGFQLSFLALLGIIYLAPALSRLFRFKNKGFLNWKENLILTLSAQLMVTPLLVAIFGGVSALSLLSNILILEFIPFTMFLGFVLGAVYLFSQTIATLIAWVTLVPLKLELGIIQVFSIFTLPLAPVFTIGGVFLYYLAMIFLIWRATKFNTFIRAN